MRNMKLTSVDLTPTNIVMITLTAVSVIFIEEKESRLSDKEKYNLENSIDWKLAIVKKLNNKKKRGLIIEEY